SNTRIVFAKWPKTMPVPGEHLVLDNSRTIDIKNVPLNGGFLTKLLLISPEPYMLARMRDPALRSYASPMVLGAPVVGMCLVKVLRSEKEGVNAGDYMYGMTHWELYTVQPYMEGRCMERELWTPETFDMDSLGLQPVPDPEGAFPFSRYTSLMGIPGLAGYSSFMSLIAPRLNTDGQKTIFVSSGAGGVGTVIIQLAKKKGLKVIASAGSDQKVSYCKKIGADYAFNYKTESYREALEKEGPIDFYYDNVGGIALEEAINAGKLNAYIVVCGHLAGYGKPVEERHGIKNTHLLYERRITIQGFLVPDLLSSTMMQQFAKDVPAWTAQSVLQSEEKLISGFENAPQAFIEAIRGGPDHSVGKLVVVVAKD
ncbi:Zinc-type alcohol dehydrogenase-like protein PB24D3.08c, partial [Leucoagaricus sp. SymC.cos]